MENSIVDVVIPAYNEQDSVGLVISEIPSLVREIVVVDNNSSDNTASVSVAAGATVLSEKQQGYGIACKAGINYLRKKETPPDIVVFLDADYSDFPNELHKVIAPVVNDNIDMVIGSRKLGVSEPGAMFPQQVFGNWLATQLIQLFYGIKYTDLGPFRAIKLNSLLRLNMQDNTYGWTVEMQVKAIKHKLSFVEVPVSYKKRIGESKIAGTVKGTILAGCMIIKTIIKYI